MTVPNFHIVIRCKNLQTLRLSFQNFSEAQKVFESLQKLSNVPAARTHLLYPFFYQSALDIVEEGWQIFDLEQVNKEMGLCNNHHHYHHFHHHHQHRRRLILKN